MDSKKWFYSLATFDRPLNDTSLPIFLDKLVPSLVAILVSVTLILMFGEIIPQSICTRYGLTIGATVAPLVQLFLWLFFPIAYPISKVLDWMLGKGHTALLQRAELKTDCGAFVCAFAKYVIHGRDIPKDIDTGHVRMGYGALLWDYGKRKLEASIKDNTTEKVGRLFGKRKRKRTHQE
ncbi:DUF21 domain-containing protein [Capsicum baccatum]|uniref:DUF21 domain-containing protein n=1 Tax=Capsicum baccatum TaxID=33114 RepID=A0A2G2WY28_CAPBA|nr:DUF21 domain-containing protein [Capsicum baccatum]